jgi:glutathione S-transferase
MASPDRMNAPLTMKLHCHPASTTSRPLLMFVAERGLEIDLKTVDLFTGEHLGEGFSALNPSRLVPVLEDDGFVLTESSAILKYLADKSGSPLYPTALQARARVNERMDWINTQLCRDLAYGAVYPQIFPHHKRPGAEAQRATVAWGLERAHQWLRVLDEGLLGERNAYLCGADPSIADHYGAAFVHLAELIDLDLRAYPRVHAWLARMKRSPYWAPTYAPIEGFVATLPRAAAVAA